MTNKWLNNPSSSLGWLRFLAIILLVLGIFFRFVNIDKKLYWGDEVYTSLRISGQLHQDMDRQLRTGHLVTIDDLHKYQYPPQSGSALDTINGLIAEESQLSPFYFVMVRWWVELFGNSVAIVRSFSVCLSLLTFPAIYWLCLELFESELVGWMSVSIVAVSPVHILYAQEARPYSLSIVAVLLSSAALLRAMRLQTKTSWVTYAGTLMLGLYTQLFFGFVIIAQGIYVILIEHFKLTKRLIKYVLAVMLGILTFTPWAWIFITHPTPGNLTWVNTKQTFVEIAIRWIGIISRAFADFGIGPNDGLGLKIAVMPIVLLVLALIIYAIYFLYRQTERPVWLFAIVLIGSICLPLMILDFGLGKRYGTTRYILPSIIGIQLAVAYLLSAKLTFADRSKWQQRIWSFIFCGLISVEISSSVLSSQAQMWWNKMPELYQDYPKVATVIDRSSRPLVITDAGITSVQILGHIVNEKTRFQIVDDVQTIDRQSGFSDIFIFIESKSSHLTANVENAYHSQLHKINDLLWQVTKSN
jgi:uncharacterized membrane protein